MSQHRLAWLLLAVGMEEGELLRYHRPDPCTHHWPHFPRCHLLLDGAKDPGRSLLLVGVLASSSGTVPRRRGLLFP